MTAELLRDAAKVLRERAEKATPGPWHAEGKVGQTKEIHAGPGMLRGIGRDLAVAERVFGRDANYILTMHPGVGLALADWLESMAAVWDGGGKYVMGSTEQKALAAMDEHEPHPSSLGGRSFAVARAILDGAS